MLIFTGGKNIPNTSDFYWRHYLVRILRHISLNHINTSTGCEPKTQSNSVLEEQACINGELSIFLLLLFTVNVTDICNGRSPSLHVGANVAMYYIQPPAATFHLQWCFVATKKRRKKKTATKKQCAVQEDWWKQHSAFTHWGQVWQERIQGPTNINLIVTFAPAGVTSLSIPRSLLAECGLEEAKPALSKKKKKKYQVQLVCAVRNQCALIYIICTKKAKQQHCTEQYIINYGRSYFPLAGQLLIMAQSGICDLLLEGLFKERLLK